MKQLRTPAAAALVLAMAACSDSATGPGTAELSRSTPAPLLSASGKGVEGRYIVVLNEGADPRSVAAVAGAKASHVYQAVLNGFAAELSPGQVNALQHNPNVAYIEEEQEYTYDVVQSSATWGIDRIDQESLPLSTTFSYLNTAGTVYAYVIDSGINPNHLDFGGRAQIVYDATGGNGVDCNGHGTHTAGTVGSLTYGVAKNVRIRAVRVGTCGSSLYTADIIEGIDWVRLNHVKPAVANMSLGGGLSSSMNTATQNLINAGVFVAVAAGNSNINACNSSPAAVTAATTVAASTSTDAKASYSNYGSCVDLYAPGSSIRSTYYSSNTATALLSGTSMASPHVAGVAALYKGTYGDASQATIDTWIKNNSSLNKITGNPTGTPNRLLNKRSL